MSDHVAEFHLNRNLSDTRLEREARKRGRVPHAAPPAMTRVAPGASAKVAAAADAPPTATTPPPTPRQCNFVRSEMKNAAPVVQACMMPREASALLFPATNHAPTPVLPLITLAVTLCLVGALASGRVRQHCV
jgi:hypothetical protein